VSRHIVAFLAVPLLLPADGTSSDHAVEVTGGMVSFVAATNFSAISVHGKSDKIRAHLHLRQTGQQLALGNIEARLDPATLSTGMALRDKHMRTKIFATENGDMPELVFRTAEVTCPAPAGGQHTRCDVHGTLSIRGVERAFRIPLTLRQDHGRRTAYRVTGDTGVQLSTWGIERPSQLGIQVADEVQLRIELLAQEQPDMRGAR
jgi:polyisoprenoid-binding protein YceI